MYLKIALNSAAVLLLAMVQIGFISALPGAWSDVNILLLGLVAVLFLFGTETAAGWAIGLGFLKDAFSFLPFGLYTLSFFLAFFLANFLLSNFFTNRSLYSFLALSASTIASFKLVLYSLAFVFNFFGLFKLDASFGKSFWLFEGTSLLINLGLTVIIFYGLNFLSKRLKPAFLLTR